MLDDYGSPEALYLALHEDVNPYRPIFTGDVFKLRDESLVIVLAHPCSIRGQGAELLEWILVAEVRPMASPPSMAKWRSGYFRQMPLPDLSPAYHAAEFGSIRSLRSGDLDVNERIACLSQFGVNLLQQRLVYHLTRFVASTRDLDTAFSHTFSEAELLEEWVEAQCGLGGTIADATKAFEVAIRQPFSSESVRTLQDCLREPQLRAPIRKRLRAESTTKVQT